MRGRHPGLLFAAALVVGAAAFAVAWSSRPAREPTEAQRLEQARRQVEAMERLGYLEPSR